MRSLVALVGVLLVLTGSGCTSESASTASGPPGIALNPDTTQAGKSPGALYSAATFPTLDTRLKAHTSLSARIAYTSTSGITGELTEVTGAVFVPNGDPPPGGWPVIAYAHATTGISSECAPSLSHDLLGSSVELTTYLAAGYLVVAPDYQGLGLDGNYHPYLNSTTAGYNVIDAVRAARHLVPEASDRWLPVGRSQGGQAAWAANELAARYGTGLALQGSVSIAPPTDLTNYVAGVEAGTLTQEQRAALQLILTTLKVAHPDVNLDDYRRGVVKENWDLLSSCQSTVSARRFAAVSEIGVDDLRPSTPEAADTLRGYLDAMSLPRTRATAPMLVVYGGRDVFQSQAWTEGALARACAMGDVIDILFDADRAHTDFTVTDAIAWVEGRFKGMPASNGCANFRPAAG